MDRWWVGLLYYSDYSEYLVRNCVPGAHSKTSKPNEWLNLIISYSETETTLWCSFMPLAENLWMDSGANLIHYYTDGTFRVIGPFSWIRLVPLMNSPIKQTSGSTRGGAWPPGARGACLLALTQPKYRRITTSLTTQYIPSFCIINNTNVTHSFHTFSHWKQYFVRDQLMI